MLLVTTNRLLFLVLIITFIVSCDNKTETTINDNTALQDKNTDCIDEAGLNPAQVLLEVTRELRRIVKTTTEKNIKHVAIQVYKCNTQGEKAYQMMQKDKELAKNITPEDKNRLAGYFIEMTTEQNNYNNDMQDFYKSNPKLANLLGDEVLALAGKNKPSSQNISSSQTTSKPAQPKQQSQREKDFYELLGGVQQGIMEYVVAVIEKEPDLAGAVINGSTAIFIAAQHGQDEIIDYLLNHGADVNTKVNGQSAIGIAINQQNLHTITFLLKKGATVDKEIISLAEQRIKGEKDILANLRKRSM